MSAAPAQPALPIRALAEFLGTALLVVGGVGTAVAAPDTGTVGIALAFGLSLLVLAYTIGPVSGCHINPAVTLGALVAKRIEPVAAGAYVVAQVLGGLAGAGVVLGFRSADPTFDLAADGLGTNGWGEASTGGYGIGAAIVVELVLTALLVMVVLAATARTSNAAVAGIPIGLALVVAHLVAVPVDGTSVNPARSLGPALLSGGTALSQVWLFVVVPLVGAVVGAVLHRVLWSADGGHAVTTATPDPTTPAATERTARH
ncbi:aquaporin Z [Klenkia marina]|uniref:Aquaporin Z n=1 Tax=Klenkia marina TaxID=1960309 RepID=A0A1G4YX96_9ACTN|nr:aquaporin [Klenkia marina]SCX58069.1 aquaporin Z [Klenkia marina]